jgi:multiple antibiotic resistance protein
MALSALPIAKRLHGRFHKGNERLVQRCTEIADRVTALVTGSFAVERILNGVASWLEEIR